MLARHQAQLFAMTAQTDVLPALQDPAVRAAGVA